MLYQYSVSGGIRIYYEGQFQNTGSIDDKTAWRVRIQGPDCAPAAINWRRR